MNFGGGFILGVVTATGLILLFLAYVGRGSTSVPKPPKPTLTDEERKKIREALTDSGNAELARKLLEQLKRRGGE